MTYILILSNSFTLLSFVLLFVVLNFFLFFFFSLMFFFFFFFFFFQAEDGIRDGRVTGVQTCALPIWEALDPGRGELNPVRRAEPEWFIVNVEEHPIVRGVILDDRLPHAVVRDRKSVV